MIIGCSTDKETAPHSDDRQSIGYVNRAREVYRLLSLEDRFEYVPLRTGHQASGPEIDEAWIRDLRLAAALHDIGKVGIADSALLKPGRLTDEERREMQRHPKVAADTLLAIYQQMGDDNLIALSVQVALYHHEKWDGSGYPFNLKAQAIPLPARIVAVADVYDALTSKRVYKDAMPHEQACQIIRNDSGTHFDPAVVDAFMQVADAFPALREEIEQNTGRPLSQIFASDSDSASAGREIRRAG